MHALIVNTFNSNLVLYHQGVQLWILIVSINKVKNSKGLLLGDKEARSITYSTDIYRSMTRALI